MKKDNKAFIIEDDEIAKTIINNILKSDTRVSSSEFYTNGQVALEKLKALISENEKPPNFIILDFDMPLMNGLEFLENIKHLEGINQIPVFMNSASTELGKYQNFLNYENVKESFSKPFTAQSLHSILEYIESNKNCRTKLYK